MIGGNSFSVDTVIMFQCKQCNLSGLNLELQGDPGLSFKNIRLNVSVHFCWFVVYNFKSFLVLRIDNLSYQHKHGMTYSFGGICSFFCLNETNQERSWFLTGRSLGTSPYIC